MGFTFNDLINEIKDTVKRDDLDGLISRVVLEAVDSICDEYPFAWLREEKTVQTTAGNPNYGITDPGGFGATDYKIRYDLRLEQTNSSNALDYMAPDLFLNTFGINDAKGVPASYTEWQDSVVLGPVPSDIYTIALRYTKQHPSIGSILVPEKEIVKRAALMRLYIDLDIPELAQSHGLLYQKLLMQLVAREHHLDYIAHVRYRDF